MVDPRQLAPLHVELRLLKIRLKVLDCHLPGEGGISQMSRTLVDSRGQTDGALGLYSSYRGRRGGHPLNYELRNTKQVHLHTPKD